MKLPEKIILLQALLADETAYVELLESLTDLGTQNGLPVHDSGCTEDMKKIVKGWLCKLVLQSEVKL
jgi:hypothetical protein